MEGEGVQSAQLVRPAAGWVARGSPGVIKRGPVCGAPFVPGTHHPVIYGRRTAGRRPPLKATPVPSREIRRCVLIQHTTVLLVRGMVIVVVVTVVCNFAFLGMGLEFHL